MSPTLQKCIGNALIDAEHATIGNEVQVMIRNKAVDAKLISKKFLAKHTKSK